jgi:IMP dehydrogenase
MNLKKGLAFDDVLLEPLYSEITSRSEISLTQFLGSVEMKIPIVSSPMDTVTGHQMASTMSKVGGIGIVHRYNSIEEQLKIVKASDPKTLGAAIGVSNDFVERARALVREGVSVLCVDIAHGHHSLMRHALNVLRNTFGSDIHIMAGNVATREGFVDLVNWGASSVRVGIGGGSICSTRIQTGHGVPTLQSILDCADASDNLDVPIVADGGIKNSGDIVKALAAGASFVMLGSLLSGTNQSPGEKIMRDGHAYKEYRGMASKRAQMDWRGRVASREGVSALVPFRGDVIDIVSELEAGIRSGLSYSGCKNINELHCKARLNCQTSASLAESNTHVFSRGIKI